MHPFTLAFIAALVCHLLVRTWLARRQMTHVAAHRNSIPQGFESAISPSEHAKAADYTVARQRVLMLETAYDAVVLLAMTLGGGIALLGDWAGGHLYLAP